MTKPFAGWTDEVSNEAKPLPKRNKEDIRKPFYNDGETYEITIGPNDKTQCYDTVDRCSEVIRIYRAKMLRHLAPCANYIMIVEVSEPTLVREQMYRPRIHFHGTITLKDAYKFLTEYLHLMSSCCTIQLSKLDKDYWDEYILKQKALMQPALGKRYWLSEKDTPITQYGNPEQHSPPMVVSPPKEQALRPKESRFTSKVSVRRAGVYNPEVVTPPDKNN